MSSAARASVHDESAVRKRVEVEIPADEVQRECAARIRDAGGQRPHGCLVWVRLQLAPECAQVPREETGEEVAEAGHRQGVGCPATPI